MSFQVGVSPLVCLLLILSPSSAFIQGPNSPMRHNYYGGKVSSWSPAPSLSFHSPTSSLLEPSPSCLKSTAGTTTTQVGGGTNPLPVGANSPTSSLFQPSETIVGRNQQQQQQKKISKLGAMLSKAGMMAFIISMCLTLPFALTPPYVLYRLKLITKVRQQQLALASGQFCARWLLRIFPFCTIRAISPNPQHDEDDPQPSIWVCNHTSALDVFILLASDLKLRGKKKRPIKIVYVRILGLKRNGCSFGFGFGVGVGRVSVCVSVCVKREFFFDITQSWECRI
jgi:hypothetical protein